MQCPFCGNALVEDKYVVDQDGSFFATYECSDCGAVIEVNAFAPDLDEFDVFG